MQKSRLPAYGLNKRVVNSLECCEKVPPGTLIVNAANGTGVRCTMMSEIHANIGFDVAVGREDRGIYIRIAEGF